MTGDAYDDGGGLDPAHKQPLPPEAEAPPVKPPLPPEAPRKQPLPPQAPRTKQPLPPGVPPVKQPLPPAVVPGGHPLPPDAPPMPSEAPRIKQPLPPETGPSGPEGPGDDGAPGEWWRTADIRGELRDTWAEHGREGWQAAQEIGAAVGAAVAARLPDPYAAAQRHRLDLRWMRLGLNIPAALLSAGVTWGGRSAEDRMAAGIRAGGLFAPLGWVLLPVLVLAVLMVLPFGGVLGAAAGALVSAAARGLVTLLRRAWSVPYLGYVLRLAAAVALWAFLLAAARLAGRAAITVLTGV